MLTTDRYETVLHGRVCHLVLLHGDDDAGGAAGVVGDDGGVRGSDAVVIILKPLASLLYGAEGCVSEARGSVLREDCGWEISEKVLEALGDSRDQTVQVTHLRLEMVKLEVIVRDTAEKVLEALNIIMVKDYSQNSVLTWGTAETRLWPYYAPQACLQPNMAQKLVFLS